MNSTVSMSLNVTIFLPIQQAGHNIFKHFTSEEYKKVREKTKLKVFEVINSFYNSVQSKLHLTPIQQNVRDVHLDTDRQKGEQ